MDSPAPHRKRNKKYNVSGHAHFLTFSCYHRLALLTNDLWRAWLAQSIRAKCDQHQISLWAYVFMPEHVHLLLKPRLVKSAEQWRWSSFGWLVLGKRDGEALQVDEWDESFEAPQPNRTRLNGETCGTQKRGQADC